MRRLTVRQVRGVVLRRAICRTAACAALWRARVLSLSNTIELRRDPAPAGRSPVSPCQLRAKRNVAKGIQGSTTFTATRVIASKKQRYASTAGLRLGVACAGGQAGNHDGLK